MITLVAIFIIMIAYILLAPVVISFSVDSSLSRNMSIKMFPFNLRIEKNGKAVKWKKIDIAFLLFSEYAAVKQILYLCFRLVKAVTLSKHHYINISLKGGFGSPDITGVVLGAIETVRPAFGKNTTIIYYPDMISPSINVKLTAQSKIYIYSLLIKTLPLILSIPVLKIVKIIIKIKKGEYDVCTT